MSPPPLLLPGALENHVVVEKFTWRKTERGMYSVLLGTAFKSDPSGKITCVPCLVVPAPLGAVKASPNPIIRVSGCVGSRSLLRLCCSEQGLVLSAFPTFSRVLKASLPAEGHCRRFADGPLRRSVVGPRSAPGCGLDDFAPLLTWHRSNLNALRAQLHACMLSWLLGSEFPGFL